MSLAKLPLLVLYSYFWRIVFTPPQPPASKEERYKSSTLDRPDSYNWRLMLVYLGVDSMSMLEAASIIVSNYPSLPVSQVLFRYLCKMFPGGQPDQLSLNWYSIAGFVFVSIGALIRFLSYRALGQFFRFEPSMQKNHQLVKTGPYSLVRHPGYTGATLAVLGSLLWAGAPGSWVRESGLLGNIPATILFAIWVVRFNIVIPFILIPRIPIEDAQLRKRFGKEWDEWAKKVPYALIPGVY
ncbi:hypothetical protein BJ912DRAFT_1030037 [Pholiota molesta]|nr:hypothetical protein BJ912DRAFT_1030037 [Pholiota molesta]